MLDLFIIYIASIITFTLFGWDKHCAIYQKHRVPEVILLLFCFLGGAFGGLCGMVLFNHKTCKNIFRKLVPVFLIIQLGIVIFLRIF